MCFDLPRLKIVMPPPDPEYADREARRDREWAKLSRNEQLKIQRAFFGIND